jgi:hypothetical protein
MLLLKPDWLLVCLDLANAAKINAVIGNVAMMIIATIIWFLCLVGC